MSSYKTFENNDVKKWRKQKQPLLMQHRIINNRKQIFSNPISSSKITSFLVMVVKNQYGIHSKIRLLFELFSKVSTSFHKVKWLV